MRCRNLIITSSLCWLSFLWTGCSMVTRGVIQGTDHDSPKAIVSPNPEHELLLLHTADGVKIIAQFGRALDANNLPLTDYAHRPTVIYCYPGGYTLQRSEKQFEEFRRLGVNVIIPEYPGFGMSEGRPSEKGCYAAADAAYAHLLSRTDIDQQQIIAAGWSVGGGVAVDLASRQQLSGVIVISTSTQMGDVVRKMAAESGSWSWVPGWLVTLMVSDCQLDTLAKIPAVACPILLIHGTADELVPKEMADRLAAAAKSKVTRYAVEGAKHGDVFTVGGTPLWQTIGEWLKSDVPRPRD